MEEFGRLELPWAKADSKNSQREATRPALPGQRQRRHRFAGQYHCDGCSLDSAGLHLRFEFKGVLQSAGHIHRVRAWTA